MAEGEVSATVELTWINASLRHDYTWSSKDAKLTAGVPMILTTGPNDIVTVNRFYSKA